MTAISAKSRDCGSMALIERQFMERHNLSVSCYAARTRRPESTVRGHHANDTSMTVNEFLQTRDNFPDEVRRVLRDIISPVETDEVSGVAGIIDRVFDAQAEFVDLGRSVTRADADGIWTTSELAAVMRDIAGIGRRLKHIGILAAKAAARTTCRRMGIRRHA